MNNKKKIIMALIAIIIIGGLIGAVYFFGNKQDKKIDNKQTEAAVTTTEEETTVNPHAGQVKSKLTGLYINKKQAAKRPVAVMINNIYDSIPQSGISNADIIYECPVEGGITRLMAIFGDYRNLDKIGSIRSCRIYYCHLALEWDAIYTHYGQSKYATDFLNSGDIDNISPMKVNTYYQTEDRVAPHNTYISTKLIDEAIDTLGYRRNYKKGYTAHFDFADQDDQVQLSGGKVAGKVSIAYPHNSPYFKYNKKKKVYERYQFDDKQIDVENNKTLTTKNIIIQFVDNTMFDDGKSLNIDLTGSGTGYYITNGKAVEIKWTRDKLTDRTKYINKKTGKEIVLNPGKSWFCLVQNSTEVTISK